MGWSGSLTAGSEAGATITYTSDITTPVGSEFSGTHYRVSGFTAPQKGVYRFVLKGSGGHNGIIGAIQAPAQNIGAGGQGGLTTYYMLLEANQMVYVGCGGACAAAFVSGVSGERLSEIPLAYIHAIAGGGGGGGAVWDTPYAAGDGGNGGGASGGAGGQGTDAAGGLGATQSSGHAYGNGAPNLFGHDADVSSRSGYGGDGLYGGWTGQALGGTDSAGNPAGAGGGGGGSGYVLTASLTVGGTNYQSATAQGGGAQACQSGSVTVTYVSAGELPVVFGGTRLTALYYNGVKVGSLIYNGTRLFYRRAEACFVRMARRFLSRRATPVCSR